MYRPADENDWKLVSRYFSPDSTVDKWGDPYAISAEHLHRLFDFRRYLGVPIYVTAGVKTTGHSKASFHYSKTFDGNEVGKCATDLVIPDFAGNCVDLVMAAERFGFGGIGYYPHWRFSGVAVGGVHVDSRPYTWDLDGTVNHRQARWMGVPRNGKQVYLPLTYVNLKKYGEEYGVY